jgi:hypothetical protein
LESLLLEIELALQPQDLIAQIANRISMEWSLSTRRANGTIWFDQLPLPSAIGGRIFRYPLGLDVAIKTRFVPAGQHRTAAMHTVLIGNSSWRSVLLQEGIGAL